MSDQKLKEENEQLKARVAELEKYNLDLANESHAKSERIAELEEELSFLRKARVKLLKEIKKQKEQGE